MGQAGDGNTSAAITLPVKVIDYSDFVDMTIGAYHACGVRKNGEGYCWGRDVDGELGNGPGITANQSRPSKIIGGNFLKVHAGTASVSYAIVDTKTRKAAPIDIARGKLGGGYLHQCYINPNSELWCWGKDADGQLGNGAGVTADQSSPYLVDNANTAIGWTMVSGGTYGGATNIHTCGIKTDGSGWCWGSDTNGQLGNGAAAASASPSPVSGTGPWSVIQAGGGFSCGIKSDGTLWCWGDDTYGQLGNGAGGSTTAPAQVGTSTWKSLGPLGIVSVCAIRYDSTLWCWGNDGNGQLGNGPSVTADQQLPYQVGTDADWEYVSTGQQACAIKTNGSAWCWGRGLEGQLGNGNTVNSDAPVLVLDPGPWMYINTNTVGGTTCGIKADGSLWCWGTDFTDGRLGNGPVVTANQSIPYPVDGGGAWKTVASTGGGSCGIKLDDSVWCWGSDSSGTAGNGPLVTTAQHSPYPVDMSFMKPDFVWDNTGAVASAQGNMALGTTPALTPYATGSTVSLAFPSANNVRLQTTSGENHLIVEGNESGLNAMLGVENAVNSYGFGYTAATGSFGFVSGGGRLSETNAALEVGNDGNVGIATGGNPAAKLDVAGGLRVTTDSCTAAKVGTISYNAGRMQYCTSAGTLVDLKRETGAKITTWDLNAKSIAAGQSYSCGLLSNGNAYCWGNGADGKLGTGNTSNSNIPVPVTGSHVFFQVTSGSNSSCGIKTDGAAWCWGRGDYGQMGNGTTTVSNSTPVPVSLGYTYSQIATGSAFSCGIRTNGAAYCWGLGNVGQMGNGTNTTNNTTPVAVSGSHLFKQIAIGTLGYFACGLRDDGAAYCWGQGALGRLGNAGVANSNVPVAVAGGHKFTKIAVGFTSACGIRTDGTAYCWGGGASGQMGNGTTTATNSSPVAVSGGGVYREITVGDDYACGIRASGNAWCWGAGGSGQMGNGTTTAINSTPVAVSGGHLFKNIIASDHTCATRFDGAAYCWGWGPSGELGDGLNSNSNIPSKVTNP